MRVRVELENQVDEVRVQEEMDVEMGDLEDSELIFAERRRLMPY